MNLEKMISNPDKVFWPDEGYNKLDIAHFYVNVFPKLKPYIADRLLTMERCPDGMRGGCFYQKEAPKGLPPTTPIKMIQHQNRNVRYVVGGALETQIALVNLGCIPVHVWGSRAKNPRQPDWMVFDLDPARASFQTPPKRASCSRKHLTRWIWSRFPKRREAVACTYLCRSASARISTTCSPFRGNFANAWRLRIPKN
jgi:DNA primase